MARAEVATNVLLTQDANNGGYVVFDYLLDRVEEAERWYRRAADAGDEDAMGTIVRLQDDRRR